MKNLLNSPGIEVKDAVLSSSRLCSGVSARSSYLGEVGNGDDTPLLPSVVVISPIFTKERKAMLTLCLPLSDVAILPSEGVAKTALLSSIVDMSELGERD